MFSFKESIFGKKETKIEEEKVVVIEPQVEPIEDDDNDSDDKGTETSREELIEEIQEALEDLTDDELDVVLDSIYSILIGEDEEDMDEATIVHQSSAERNLMKRKRRMPKWKKKAKIRYIKNKKCPAGTSWSSEKKSCTPINIDLSRLQKVISKMKVRGL